MRFFFLLLKDSTTAPAWSTAPLPDVTLGRRRNVSRLRAMGGDCTSVPPDFNDTMKAIWEELWNSMPQSGKIGVTVNTLLQRYKERCRTERKRPRHSSESPPALLSVSFAHAKDWLLKQQKAQSEALHVGAVNEDAREVVAVLNHSLTEQPTATAALLDQPARPAAPVLPPPAMSLGPEQVTDSVRAAERAEERSRKATELSSMSTKKAVVRKQKPVSPEMEERQKLAAAHMQELGVPPLQVCIYSYSCYIT